LEHNIEKELGERRRGLDLTSRIGSSGKLLLEWQ